MIITEEAHGAVVVHGTPGPDPVIDDVADLAALPALVRPVAVLSMDAGEHAAQHTATAVNNNSMKV